MIITYLHHSGFLVNVNNINLVFDPISDISYDLLGDRKTYFLVSHAHGDHYSNLIWDYDSPNTTFILSSDISRYNRLPNVMTVNPDEKIQINDNLSVITFGSTDQGVSFLVETEGKNIFFSGDLNWWAWDTRTRPHIDPVIEERDFKREISKLKSYLGDKKIDVAFVPVDPRLDREGELKAAEFFIEELKPDILVPMHFWGDFKVIDRLINDLPKNCPTTIAEFTGRNQTLEIVEHN